MNHLDRKQINWQRQADGTMLPYPARRELVQSGALNGQELVYLADEFDAYIVSVQGSGLAAPDRWFDHGSGLRRYQRSPVPRYFR